MDLTEQFSADKASLHPTRQSTLHDVKTQILNFNAHLRWANNDPVITLHCCPIVGLIKHHKGGPLTIGCGALTV